MTKFDTNNLDIREGDALIIIRLEGKRVKVYGSVEKGYGLAGFEDKLDKIIKALDDASEQFNRAMDLCQTPPTDTDIPPASEEQSTPWSAEIRSLRNCGNCGRPMMSRMLCVQGVTSGRLGDQARAVRERHRWWWDHESDSETTDDPCPEFITPYWMKSDTADEEQG
jgi:hypothetical protein